MATKKTDSIKDMQPKINDVEYQKHLEMQRRYRKELNANELVLSANVVDKRVKKGNEIINKQTGLPETDKQGEIRRYDDTHIITLLFMGGRLEYKCDEDMFSSVEIGSTYKFTGYMGVIKEFGKDVISPIFQSSVEI